MMEGWIGVETVQKSATDGPWPPKVWNCLFIIELSSWEKHGSTVFFWVCVFPSLPALPLPSWSSAQTAFMRSNSTLFKAASGFPWCCAKTCPQEKQEQSRQHVEQKNAHNSAALELGIREVPAPKTWGERWKEKEGGREGNGGRERKAEEEREKVRHWE